MFREPQMLDDIFMFLCAKIAYSQWVWDQIFGPSRALLRVRPREVTMIMSSRRDYDHVRIVQVDASEH